MTFFSDLTEQFDQPPNPLYQWRARLLKRGESIIDLVSGNVNTQGIIFPPLLLRSAMRKALQTSRIYAPDPLGQPAARKAVGRFYASEGISVPEEQIIITPGTSISYWYAFKLLANPGDEVLCPCPAYPLIESIAAIAGIKLVSYRLKERERWEIDFAHLESLLSARTKAIVLISPHNPTGAVATEEEVHQLSALAIDNKLAIISDEVFSPFVFNAKALPRPAGGAAPLVLTLNGLSKMLALPGMKIGWMAVTGQPALVKKAMTTLAMISDTFLPVNEAVQNGFPALLMGSTSFQKDYQQEIRKRLRAAEELLNGQANVSFVKPEGGFFMALNLNRDVADEAELAQRILENHRILVHPGYFYDMEGQHLILTFVSRATVFRKSINAILREIAQKR